MGDALQRVIQRDRQMIARRRIGAPQNDIAPGGGVGYNKARLSIAGLLPAYWPLNFTQRLFHVEPVGEALGCCHLLFAFPLIQMPLFGRIERRAIRIARPGAGFPLIGLNPRPDLAAGEEGGVDDAALDQAIQGLTIKAEMLGLATDRLFEANAEPVEIGKDRGLEFGGAAGDIDIFEPQQQAPAACAGHLGVEEGRERMTQMQPAVGARRKTEGRLALSGLTDRVAHGFPSHGTKIRKRGERRMIIRDEADLKLGLATLLERDPRLEAIAEACGPLPIRLSPPGFAGLASIIVSQMVSRASAEAIWRRMTAVLGHRPTAEDYLSLPPEVISTFGLSRGKALALEAAAKEDLGGAYRLDEVALMPGQQAIAALTSLKGIGPWTAEVYLMFCGGHPDIFPVGDVALRISVGDVFFAGERPTPEAVEACAQAWAPVRSVAARLFWAHYARMTGRVALPR